MSLLHRLLLGQPAPFFAVTLLSLVARGQAIAGPLYSTDDYALLRTDALDYRFLLSQGRFGTVGLEWLRELLGYTGVEVSTSALIVAVLLLTHSGLLLAHVVLRKPTTIETSIFLVLYALHPFATEFFFFAGATLDIAIALWLASAAMYVTAVGGRMWLATATGVVGLVLALAVYQTAIAQALAIAVLALVARLTIIDPPSREPLLRSPQVRVLGAVVLSVPAYLMSNRIVSWITGVPADARASVSSVLADIPGKASSMLESTRWALWPEPRLIEPLDSVVLILLMVVSTVAVAWAGIRRSSLIASLAAVALILAALVWAGGSSALADPVWIVPRRVVGIAALAAGLLMLGWRASSSTGRLAPFAIGLTIPRDRLHRVLESNPLRPDAAEPLGHA